MKGRRRKNKLRRKDVTEEGRIQEGRKRGKKKLKKRKETRIERMREGEKKDTQE